MTEYLLSPAAGKTLANSLSALVPQLKPLDTIRLDKGFHGDTVINWALPGRVTIIANSGATLGKTVFGTKAKNWTSAYLAFRGFDPTPTNNDDITRLVDVAPGAEAINFQNCTFAATDDVRGWTDADWVSKPNNVGLLHRGSNSTIKGGRFFNVRNALSVGGVGNTVDGVLIEDFGNDAVQMGESDGLTVQHCIIRRGHHSGVEKLHGDAGQVVLAKDGVCQNLTVQDNIVDMTGAVGDYLQGISGFDGIMKNIKILRNKITCDAFHGVALYGAQGGEVAGNVVVGSRTTKPWIRVCAAKDGRPSTGVSVHDNTATGGVFDTPTAKGP